MQKAPKKRLSTAQEELQYLREQKHFMDIYARAFDYAPLPTILWNLNEIIFINRKAKTYLGYVEEEILGEPLSSFMTEGAKIVYDEHLTNVEGCDEGTTFEVGVQLVLKSGRTQDVFLKETKVLQSNGNSIFMSMIKDPTGIRIQLEATRTRIIGIQKTVGRHK